MPSHPPKHRTREVGPQAQPTSRGTHHSALLASVPPLFPGPQASGPASWCHLDVQPPLWRRNTQLSLSQKDNEIWPIEGVPTWALPPDVTVIQGCMSQGSPSRARTQWESTNRNPCALPEAAAWVCGCSSREAASTHISLGPQRCRPPGRVALPRQGAAVTEDGPGQLLHRGKNAIASLKMKAHSLCM